jgi:signal transduction histidine kinase
LIANYHLKITDFPKQDYIAEFLFLQQAATRGLEDSKQLTKNLTEKNKELEISKNALINSNSILEHQVNERTKKIKNLALFPEQNPNPVLELDYEKKEIVYLNPVAKQKTEKYNLATFTDICNNFKLTDELITAKQNKKYEFNFNDKVFDTSVYFLETVPTIRLYLHDITEIRLKEKLEKIKQETFIEQQKTLLDLRNLSQELTINQKLEVIYRKTSAILKCDRCSVWLFNEEKNAINATSIYLKQTDAVIDGMSLYSKDFPKYFDALNKDEVIAATDAETHKATAEFTAPYLKPLNIVSMLDIPIIKSNKSIGVICNEYIENKHEFTEGDIAFAQSISDVISLAYETEQLQLSKLELKEKNESLQHAYNELVNLQTDLINQEKLATLGLLIAGIAHEVNTPLGAIKASNDNIKHAIINDLIRSFQIIRAEDIKKSIDLFLFYKKPTKILSTREEREMVKSIEIELVNGNYKLSNTLLFARKIYELGYSTIEPQLEEYINHANSALLFSFTSNLIKVLRSIDTIEIAVDKASKVVKALNNFSHGNITNEITNFKLHESIDSVITILWNKIKYGSSVINDIDDSILMNGNQEELSQVWTNIINNALQASANKCIIKISYANKNNHHEITFSNNGPEIPADAIPKIFDAFYSTKKRGEGTGLGLNIVKKIIDKHKGHIICNSNINETNFIITLPN